MIQFELQSKKYVLLWNMKKGGGHINVFIYYCAVHVILHYKEILMSVNKVGYRPFLTCP